MQRRRKLRATASQRVHSNRWRSGLTIQPLGRLHCQAEFVDTQYSAQKDDIDTALNIQTALFTALSIQTALLKAALK